MALVFWQLCPVWIRRARACRFKHYLFSGSLAAWCGVSSIYESYSARHFINWNPAKKFSKSASVSFSQFAPGSRPSETVESFGRRQASESLRCPNRGGHGLSYGESCFALIVGKPGAAEKRTCAIADRLDMGRKSGRGKSDGPILIWRRLLLGSVGASGSASRRGCALDRVGARPCRVTAQVSRMRVGTVAAREADSGARTPR